MREERKQLMDELEALSRVCAGCKKNPVNGSQNRVSWCNQNCTDIAPQMRIIGHRLDVVSSWEREDRDRRIMALPMTDKRRQKYLDIKKEATAATVDLVAL